MAEDGEIDSRLGCSREKWASYQELLLAMTSSTVDEITGIVNSDPTWDDPIRVSQLVQSVAGSRKNDQELIDLIKKVSETRGYSALYSALETIEKLIDDAAFLGQSVSEVVEAMARGARSEAVRAAASLQGPTSSRAFPQALRDAVVTELRNLGVSESFMSPLRTALSGLRSLVDAISDPGEAPPMPAFDQAGSAREVVTRAWSVAGELVRGQSGALSEAIDGVVTLSLPLDGSCCSARFRGS
jgi:hypothetical protein